MLASISKDLRLGEKVPKNTVSPIFYLLKEDLLYPTARQSATSRWSEACQGGLLVSLVVGRDIFPI